MYRIEDPTKSNLRDVAKLSKILDFLKEKYRPFTAVAKEAVKRGIIKAGKENSLYDSFTRVNKRVGLFEGIFLPSDQSPTGRSRWEWKVTKDMTEKEFLRRINEYNDKNFKKGLYEK